ncbi:MAG: hypothetical protein DHS20C12_27840 [Pseudohongiella sp.]|nr:MAG: hypothetical protein DHS20C12_27840 [Pseudohongiella sp.]
MLVALALALLFSGLSVVSVTHENRVAFNRLQELRDESNALQVERGQLLIEQSTFGLEDRIELSAANSLGLVLPDPGEIVVLRLE